MPPAVAGYYAVLAVLLFYLSHLLQGKTLYFPQILGQIYTCANSAHPDQEQSDNGLYCLTFNLHSDMYMYALMKHADHFQTIMSIIFGVQMFISSPPQTCI